MAPTESAILENFLLIPSQLPAIIAPHDFTALFPRAHQSSPSVRTLYRDLQSQRSVITDEVAANIQAEARRSKTLRRAAVRTQREIKAQEYDRELERERMLFGDASGLEAPKHSLHSILPELEITIDELEAEVETLEKEEAHLRQSLSQTIGNLSDLRYGR